MCEQWTGRLVPYCDCSRYTNCLKKYMYFVQEIRQKPCEANCVSHKIVVEEGSEVTRPSYWWQLWIDVKSGVWYYRCPCGREVRCTVKEGVCGKGQSERGLRVEVALSEEKLERDERRKRTWAKKKGAEWKASPHMSEGVTRKTERRACGRLDFGRDERAGGGWGKCFTLCGGRALTCPTSLSCSPSSLFHVPFFPLLPCSPFPSLPYTPCPSFLCVSSPSLPCCTLSPSLSSCLSLVSRFSLSLF